MYDKDIPAIEQETIQTTLAMMHALDNGATIDADALALALKTTFGLDVTEYGYHDIDGRTTENGAAAYDLRANGGIVITRNVEYDYVNLPIYGVDGILVSTDDDGAVLWSLGLSNGDVLY